MSDLSIPSKSSSIFSWSGYSSINLSGLMLTAAPPFFSAFNFNAVFWWLEQRQVALLQKFAVNTCVGLKRQNVALLIFISGFSSLNLKCRLCK
jgi:hypothetical protein